MAQEKKKKVFFERSKESFELALSIGKTQEDKALLKAEKHHQRQAGQPRSERAHQSKKKKKLDEVKAAIASQQARLKRAKVKAKWQQQRPPACADVHETHQKSRPSSADGNARARDDAAPRKRVSFA